MGSFFPIVIKVVKISRERSEYKIECDFRETLAPFLKSPLQDFSNFHPHFDRIRSGRVSCWAGDGSIILQFLRLAVSTHVTAAREFFNLGSLLIYRVTGYRTGPYLICVGLVRRDVEIGKPSLLYHNARKHQSTTLYLYVIPSNLSLYKKDKNIKNKN